jgi:hypothetical protein
MKLIYLSAPYTTGPDTPQERQADIDWATAWLMRLTDVYIFSPITYEKPLKEFYGTLDAASFDKAKNEQEWAFWGPRDKEMVTHCDELWVLCLNGWENSRGVNFEIERAKSLGKPVHYLKVHKLLTIEGKWRMAAITLPDGKSIVTAPVVPCA